MFQSLVSQTRATGGGPQEHIEAVTAERDFFREKYATQIKEIEYLKSQLNESRRVIDRLRKQVLDLEMQRSAPGRCLSSVAAAGGAVARNKALAGFGSSSTSLTSMTFGEEESIRSSPGSVVESLQADEEALACDSCGGEDQSSGKESTRAHHVINQVQSAPDVNDKSVEHKPNTHNSTDEDEASKESSVKDEAERIRANAERMLQWANYQTTRRTTVSPSTTPTAKIMGEHENAYVNSLTKFNGDMGEECEDSISANTWNLRDRSTQSDSTNLIGGKMNKFLNKMKDIIDPPSAYTSESDDESSAEESTSTIDHRSFDE